MSDSCGQVNAASIASAQLANISNAAQVAKGGRNVMMPNTLPSQQHQQMGNLLNDFNQMNLGPQAGGMVVENKPAAVLLNNGGINQGWGQPQPMQNGVPQANAMSVPTMNPAAMMNPQQGLQQQQQHQQHMVRQQSMMQQHHQQQVMMNMFQQQQQQQMMMQQQQQQMMVMAMQQQQQQHQPQVLQQPAPSTAVPITAAPLQQPPTSKDLFASLREQQATMDKQEAEMEHGLDTEMEEPHGDISQYLSDNYSHHMFHAGGTAHHVPGANQDSIAAVFSKMATSDNEKWKNSKFVQFVNQYQSGEIEFEGDEVIRRDLDSFNQTNDPMSNLNEDLWNGLLEDAQNEENDLYSEVDEAVDDEVVDDYGEGDWPQDWLENWQNNIELPQGYEELQKKIQENIRKYTTPPDANAYEHGVVLFERGELYQAIEVFNRVTVHDPTHSNAWMYLGKSYAQVDQDALAIQCLEKCISLDAYNSTALLALGISLSNSCERPTAVSHLATWIAHNPDFAGNVDTSPVESIINTIRQEGPSEALTEELNRATITMFLDAAKISDKTDPELQTVLGLLHLINGDYPSSIASFTSALAVQPNNAELWNRLGAVIANSGRHSDAPNFYKQALHLRPNYLRAKVNCAQAHVNIQQYHLAYPIFLDIIFNSPDSTNSENSPHPHLWPILKQCFQFCGMPQLADAAQTRDVGILKHAMDENGMNPDGSIRPGAQPPLGADFE